MGHMEESIQNPLKWCDICRRMTNHETQECYYCPRGDNDARNEQPTRPNPNGIERARLVLGTQPPLPRTTEVRYVEREAEEPCYNIVPTTPYSLDELPMSYEQSRDPNPNQYFMLMGIERGHRFDAFAKRGPQPSGTLGPCFRCQGDH